MSKAIICGCGARGMLTAKLLVKDLGRKVAALVEPYTDNWEEIDKRMAEFGQPSAPKYKTLEEALASTTPEEANMIFVMTTNWVHLRDLKLSLDAGRHVFLEKPLAPNASDVNEIHRLANSTDKTVQVGFVLRYAPFYHKIKEIADSGELGRIVMIQMNEYLDLLHGASYQRNWRRKQELSGGFMNEKCSHDMDLMCWIKESQAQPIDIFSNGNRMFYETKREVGPDCDNCKAARDCPFVEKTWEGWNTTTGIRPQYPSDASPRQCVYLSDSEVKDNQCSIIRFADGTQGVFTVCQLAATGGRDIRIYGTEGYLEGEMESGKIKTRVYWKEAEFQDRSVGLTDCHGGGDIKIIQEFLKCVEEGRRPLSTIDDGARACLLAFASDISATEKRFVTLDEMRKR